jgi:hypothetical protein
MLMNRPSFAQVALVVGIAVASVGVAAQTTELMLYGTRLKDATVKSFAEAAVAAGAKRIASNEFDVRAVGVPALKSFHLLPAGESLIGVRFNVERNGAGNEKLRQMLVAKYGNPENGSTMRSGSFTSQYIAHGSYHWKFAHGMRLIYKMPFFSNEAATLTYVDQVKFDELERLANSAEHQDASKKAQSKSDKF